jgi:hypothetical protein
MFSKWVSLQKKKRNKKKQQDFWNKKHLEQSNQKMP